MVRFITLAPGLRNLNSNWDTPTVANTTLPSSNSSPSAGLLALYTSSLELIGIIKGEPLALV
jgi:hypothetical protein